MFKKQKQLSEDNKPKIFNFPGQTSRSSYTQYNAPPNRPQLNGNNNVQTNDDAKKQLIDMKRLKRAIFEFQVKEPVEQKEEQPQRKQAVKMNVFRESARQRQRQFHQQNHEFLRMFSVIASSAMMDKFKIKQHRDGSQSGANKGQNKASKTNQNFATVHLQLATQMTSSLISYKFPMKDTYNTMPFKRQSIEFESREFLDPNYEFFVFEKCPEKIEEVKNELRNVLEEGLTSEFKSSVIRTVGNLSYFEYLDLTNYRTWSARSNAIQYPKEIIEIAQHNQSYEINSDEQEMYIRGEIKISEDITNERMVSCDDHDLQQTSPSVYFQLTEDYTLYKKYRFIEFKKLKIYDKDISINSDIRNIISSQKIYLIELIKEIDLYIELSSHNADVKIMKEILNQLKRKSEEFLKVICNYTESKILKHYNIDNYHQKIMMFIEKSIKYNKEIQNLPPEILKEFPILKIWYEIPQTLFGYSREKLHGKYYDLIRATLKYDQKIKDMDLERQLRIKRPQIQYPE